MNKYLLLLRNANNYEELYKIKYYPIRELEQYPNNLWKILIKTKVLREIYDCLRELYQIQILPDTCSPPMFPGLELYWYDECANEKHIPHRQFNS